VPAQLAEDGTVLFLAAVPSVGFAVYDVRPAAAPATGGTSLSVTESALENARYRVEVDGNGDIASIFDKRLGRELLSGPSRLEIKTDNPRNWPAWNMDWEDQVRAPRAFVAGPVRARIVERGPVRVALEVARETEGSSFVQTIRLAAGDAGNRIEIGNVVDWNTREAHLKAVFPLTAENRAATYNLDVGTIERGNNDERQFEVASHQWFDLTDRRLRRDGPLGFQVRVGQARREHAPAHADADPRHPGRIRGSGYSGHRPPRVRLRSRGPRLGLA
jgi:alpha-mannosidase